MPKNKQKRILSGDRPTGRMHIGHFVGSLKNKVELQNDYDEFLLIADYHSITTKYDPEHIKKQGEYVREVALAYLSVGINPEKTTIYLQSLVPQVTEIALLFGMMTKVPRLERIPTLKGKIKETTGNIASYGLLGYPLLQVADILGAKGELVPVGKDQESHVELSRETAQKFNNMYGIVFPEPEVLIGDIGSLPGLDGNEKMSKSLGNCIYLNDDKETVLKKVMSMYTDPNRIHPTDPGTVENNPVFIYHDAFNPNVEEVKDLKDRYKKGTVGDVEVKQKLATALNEFLDPFRETRAEWESRMDDVDQIILEGSKKADAVFSESIAQMRDSMGYNYLS